MLPFIKQFNYFRRRNRKRLKRNMVWLFRVVAVLILLDAVYLFTLWPNWSDYSSGKVKKTEFINQYLSSKKQKPKLPTLKWNPIPITWIPKHLQRAVLVAEDARFYEHQGIDVEAFKEAMDYNLEHMKFKYGGSTISQQTIKNMFLSSSRNPLRKWHELILTFGMEMSLTKKRILEIYLNVAEFGRGIYGIEAAAQHYWGVSAVALSHYQAAQLAATLPSPIKHNPRTQTKRFNKRVRRILRLL
ncbi:Monofunctional biosynthetic peptidoglycan transglycosylase [hydrothermal vent metagenome]|uniref:Monofunctional biosynthetic peptidoglycan transglycosylase n=1 Tax=hydrothermal vent metagenome TaxID=652676 RepID=A0A3B1AQI9_9ZZZZ